MKKRTLTVLAVLSVLLLGGCYPQGAEYTEDLDIVITKHNQSYDFSAKNTYAMPDKIVKITGNLVEGDAPKFIPDAYAKQILDKIASNMAALGYTKVALDQNPDLLLSPASWENTTIYYYYDYWYWWYGGYYPYWGYPGYGYATSYTTGTLLMLIRDPNDIDGSGSPIVEWAGAINGLLSGTYSLNRVNKGVDQAFAQSPYLTTN